MKKSIFLLAVFALVCVFPALAGAQCPEREEVSSWIEQGISTAELNSIFAECTKKQLAEGEGARAEKGQQTEPTGSVYWEAIDSCGYHPQRRELHCSLEVRQQFGFGGFPGVGPGSWEWVQFCVADGGGLRPINVSAVHVHDEQLGFNPPWYYGVSVQADERLHAALTNGQTLEARAILSWALVPTGCNYTPVWGNQADFQIKLDP